MEGPAGGALPGRFSAGQSPGARLRGSRFQPGRRGCGVVPWGKRQDGRSPLTIGVLPAALQTLESSIQGLRIM